MKILILGTGAVGSFYGSLLARQGATVAVVARADYPVVRAHGIHVHSEAGLGDYHFRPEMSASPESCRHDVLQALQPGAGEVMSVAQESGVVSRSAPTVSRSTINNTAPTKVMTPNASRHPMACWNHG
jgi:2-polyprenyl-6-methoxyphenol hydroxylase-like FAD-dependent oxidoreductase